MLESDYYYTPIVLLHGSGYKVFVIAHWVKWLKLYSTFHKDTYSIPTAKNIKKIHNLLF